MIWWIVLGVYLLLCLGLFIGTARELGTKSFLGFAILAVGCLFWPLFIPVFKNSKMGQK